MKFQVTGWCSVHEGGTKFYELVHIKCEDTSRQLIVRRWGKGHLRQTSGGAGEVMLKYGETLSNFGTQRNAKAARGYTGSSPGVAGGLGRIERAMPMAEDMLTAALGLNYGGVLAAHILGYLKGEPTFVVVDIIDESPLESEPVKEPPTLEEQRAKRGDSWGSW